MLLLDLFAPQENKGALQGFEAALRVLRPNSTAKPNINKVMTHAVLR